MPGVSDSSVLPLPAIFSTQYILSTISKISYLRNQYYSLKLLQKYKDTTERLNLKPASDGKPKH